MGCVCRPLACRIHGTSSDGFAHRRRDAAPRPAAWAAGQAVPPEEALPLYIRDKVAQTTDERMQIKAQQAAVQ